MPEGLARVAEDRMKAILGYVAKSRVAATAAGAGVTALIQSSSATIGIAIALANAGGISLWTAVPIALGDNIGTTVTALLALIVLQGKRGLGF